MALKHATSSTAPSAARLSSSRQQRQVRSRCRPLHAGSPKASTTSTTAAHASAAGAAAAAPASRPAHQQQQPQVNSSPKKLQRHERLRDPAKIGSRGAATVMVDDAGGSVSLATYMQLPVEQYYILDPSQIALVSGNTFVLSVPKINLLGASLQPVITVEVTSAPDAVVLQATDCQLNATGIMGGLDGCFAMQFTTRLTWKSPQHPQHQQHLAPQEVQEQQHRRQLDALAAEQAQLKAQQQAQAQANGASLGAGGSIREGWDRLRQGMSSGSSNAAQSGRAGAPAGGGALRGSITGSASVDVWCEVIPPFNLMPREVLVGTCNTVISGLINSLLPWFTRQLAADYQKWAREPAYRAARAARSRPQQVQQVQDSLN